MLPVFEMPLKPSLQASPRVQPALNIVDETQLPSSPRKETNAQQPLDVAVLRADGVLAEADFQPRQQSSARERAKFDEQGLPISWALQVAGRAASFPSRAGRDRTGEKRGAFPPPGVIPQAAGRRHSRRGRVTASCEGRWRRRFVVFYVACALARGRCLGLRR